ncbi:MAG: dihydrodipicolinate reductase [Acidimicrobiales bacterium]|nr:MAG: dihydrodipicolinate reductase [Acidimicrobiales bacterium]
MSPRRVVVWGTGNVGRTAIRTVLAHRDLELADVVVHSASKVGRDAGELAAIGATGVLATDDVDAVLGRGPDAVVYAASGDTRPTEALDDVLACLRAGASVVTPAIYALLHPATADPRLRAKVDEACEAGGSSFYVSGIDPGWAQDILPLLVTGVAGQIDEIRMQELFDYSTYDAPEIVREVIGFGKPMDYLPPMLIPSVPTMIWGPMIRTVADGLGVELDDITESIERLALSEPVDTIQGRFDAGTQGAFRFAVTGHIAGEPRIVVEHITRIAPHIAPEWPMPAPGKSGEHRLVVEGRPRLEVSIHATDGTDNPADGGNATAAARLVNVIPVLVDATPGVKGTLDLPPVVGGGLGGELPA